MSEMNLKMASIFAKDQYSGTNEKQFWAFIHLISKNCAIDFLRNKNEKKSSTTSNIDDVIHDYSTNSVRQPNFEIATFSEEICNGIKKYLNQNEIKVFDAHFVKGLNYEETAEKLHKPLGSVKAQIHRIKKIAIQRFGNKYNEIMN